MTHSHLAQSVLESVVVLPDLFNVVERNLNRSLESLSKCVHFLLFFPGSSSLIAVDEERSESILLHRGEKESGTYGTLSQKVDKFEPKVSSSPILSDVSQGELESSCNDTPRLLRCFDICRIDRINPANVVEVETP